MAMKASSASRNIFLGLLVSALAVFSAAALWQIGTASVDPEVRAGENRLLAEALLLQVARLSPAAEQDVLKRAGFSSLEAGLQTLIADGNKLHELRGRSERWLKVQFLLVWLALTIQLLIGIRMVRHGLAARRSAAGEPAAPQPSAA